jgi:AraC-like DNA-binding protein
MRRTSWRWFPSNHWRSNRIGGNRFEEPLLKSWDIVAADLDEWIFNVKHSCWHNLMGLYREHELLLDAWHAEDEGTAEQATHQHLEAGWHRRKMAEGLGGEDLDPVQRAVSFIATHFASRLEMAWVARHVSFVSAGHLARMFKDKMGVSPNSSRPPARAVGRAARCLENQTQIGGNDLDRTSAISHYFVVVRPRRLFLGRTVYSSPYHAPAHPR